MIFALLLFTRRQIKSASWSNRIHYFTVHSVTLSWSGLASGQWHCANSRRWRQPFASIWVHVRRWYSHKKDTDRNIFTPSFQELDCLVLASLAYWQGPRRCLAHLMWSKTQECQYWQISWNTKSCSPRLKVCFLLSTFFSPNSTCKTLPEWPVLESFGRDRVQGSLCWHHVMCS